MRPLAQRRLAGFRFEVQPPVLPEALPRMDIAVFVGFAAAGPVDRPLVVEDTAHFRDLFGDDLPLAWDPKRGRIHYAHLGSSVRAFFRNGGRRCWVIRVADRPQTDLFPLSGMLELRSGELRPAFARARSAGSWFDALECATALTPTPLAVMREPSLQSLLARLPTGTECQIGDLLRFVSVDRRLHGFAVVQGVKPAPASSLTQRSRLFDITCREVGVFEEARSEDLDTTPCTATWTRAPQQGNDAPREVTVSGSLHGTLASPPSSLPASWLELRLLETSSPQGGAFSPGPGNLIKVETTPDRQVLWLRVAKISPTGTPTVAGAEAVTQILGQGFWVKKQRDLSDILTWKTVEHLALELHVRRGETEAMRLTKLGMTWASPRCWSALPTDEELAEYLGPPTIPSARPDDRHLALWREALENPSAGGRFPVAGAKDQDACFVPLLVQPLPRHYLPAEHSDEDELRRDGLDRFHAGLFLDQALVESRVNTLRADAEYIRYQQPNPRRLRGIHAAFELEEATLIAIPDAVHVGWRARVEDSAPSPQVSPLLPHPSWGLSETCNYDPQPPSGAAPRFDKFLNCPLRVLTPPVLVAAPRASGGGAFELRWSTPDTDVDFVLEEATQADFTDATIVYRGRRSELAIYGHLPGAFYYRVRARAGSETSNWSNGLVITLPLLSRYEVVPRQEETTDLTEQTSVVQRLLDVHRALLRLAAARGDLMAILTLPEHFRADDCLAYVRQMRPETSAASGYAGTPSLEQPERPVLSFGSLYHPWLLIREDEDQCTPVPPDGAAAGIIARRAWDRGAWIAPANEPFRGVLGLTPLWGEGRRLDLLLAQINQITQEATGFLALNADTLSDDEELRPINVRRLLILLRRAALQRGADYVFEPNGPALRRLVQHSFESLLDRLFVRGAFAGATRATSYEVVTDASINTPQSVELGRFQVDLKVAPSLPLSFVTVRLVQTGERGLTMELY